jgi:anti-anti-sigma factor
VPLNVALVPGPDQVVLRLTGDADLSTFPTVAEALSQAAGLGTRQVVVDVATVHFWDSSGLRALAAFTGDLAAAGRSCRIVGRRRPPAG